MLNNQDFINRLQEIISHYNLTASSFADKIGVQRSSISHLLSGRNKPSLDFILKITSTFNEVDIYWLVNGKGSFPKAKIITEQKTTSSYATTLFDSSTTKAEEKREGKKTIKEIQRIVVFYNDGTFEEYKNTRY
ncbi:helix-turn-helix domain-containing protein [Tenacibaculum sp. UWU-22]|uniref:helix-turn-helix domain-containing protein n=1 Tax=Tenacibaculum sp. UWU-22 TaxID=3234187 RepID=UPI0034DB5756